MIAATPENEREMVLPKLRTKPMRTASVRSLTLAMNPPVCVQFEPIQSICLGKESHRSTKAVGSQCGQGGIHPNGRDFHVLTSDYRDYFTQNLHDALSGHTSSNVKKVVRYSEHSGIKYNIMA
eukprot:Gb_26680 [translate_table: standard]